MVYVESRDCRVFSVRVHYIRSRWQRCCWWGPRPGHKRIGAPSNNGSPARPMYCDYASGKCPTLIASLRVCGGKNLSLDLGPVHK
jgi:hypothetical protein